MTTALPQYADDTKIDLSDNSRKVLERRYLRRDADGNVTETPAGMFYRVARHVAQPDAEHGADVDATTRTFYDLLSSYRFFPNSPTFTGAGTPLGQLAACFVLPIADDMGKSSDGIFSTLRAAALIQQTGGGNGFSFSRLRPAGDFVHTSAGKATGPIGFLKVYDQAFGEIAQGGTRRGANMGILRCLSGRTQIHTLKGKIPIEKLVGTRPYVYACEPDSNKVHLVKADKVFVSDRNRKLVRVWLDNDEYIDCTEDHLFMLSNGEYKPAETLTIGDSLMAFQKRIIKHGTSDRHVVTIGCTGGRNEYEHRVVARDILGEVVDKDNNVHHIDHDPLNNMPGNLKVLSRSEHVKAHAENFDSARIATAKLRKGRTLEEVYGIEKAAEWRRNLSRARKEIANHKVVRVEPIGVASEVYDISLPKYHNFAANEVFVHNCDHPDIEDFIECKSTEGAISNFNISVAITDEFMQSVEANAAFDLRNPRDGRVWRTVKARDLFAKIIKYAHRNGEPGAFFIDAANRQNPMPQVGEIEATNPCAEQSLLPYENCCLGSIHLGVHVTPDGEVDWALLQRTVEESTHFLDNVVTANAYVPAVPELREAGLRARRIGLGIMGLGDMMYKLGVRYGSEEGQEFAAQIMEFVRYHSMARSIGLAIERGPFPAIDGSIYDPFAGTWHAPEPLEPYEYNWDRPALFWDAIERGIQRHGIRNACQTTVAPTGTIATVTGCEGYGCEPVFALGYVRHFKDGDKDVELVYTSPLFDAALNETELSEARKDEIRQHVATHGNCQDILDLPSHIRNTFVVSEDVTPEEHVRMQAAIQAFVDNGISKTINLPANATERDVADAYMLAWKLGCKGLTVYVTGSREQVVLETKATRTAQAQAVPTQTKRPRPGVLNGATYRKDTPLGTAYITVNSDEHAQPFEVFLNVGKAGSDVSAVSESMGRLISLVLRMPGNLPAAERMRWIMDEMVGIGGGRSLGFGAARVRSLPDGIAQVLAEHLGHMPTNGDSVPDTQLSLAIGDICPECGEAAFLNVEGCRKCHVCGYSEC